MGYSSESSGYLWLADLSILFINLEASAGLDFCLLMKATMALKHFSLVASFFS